MTALAFAPDGRHLYSGFDYSGSSAGGGLVWELQADAAYPKWVVIKRIPASSQINAAAFLPDGNRLVTANEKGDVEQYAVDTGVPVGKAISHGTAVRSLALHPDGATLLTLSAAPVGGSSKKSNVETEFYQIRRWNLDTGDEIVGKTIQIPTPNAFTLSVAANGDEALVVAAAPKGKSGTVVHRYDLESRAELPREGESFLDSGRKDKFGKADLRQYWGAIYAPAADGASDKKRILALHGTRAELVKESGELDTRSNPHGQVKSVSYSDDNKFFLTAGSDGTIKIWDAETRIARCQIVSPHGDLPSSIYSAAFSPVTVAGRYQVLSAGRDKSAKLWSWDGRVDKDGQAAKPVLARQLTHDSNVRNAAFSHDAGQIACGCDDGTVWVWNARTRNRVPAKRKSKMRTESIKKAIRVRCAASPSRTAMTVGSQPQATTIWRLSGKTRTSSLRCTPS